MLHFWCTRLWFLVLPSLYTDVENAHAGHACKIGAVHDLYVTRVLIWYSADLAIEGVWCWLQVPGIGLFRASPFRLIWRTIFVIVVTVSSAILMFIIALVQV